VTDLLSIENLTVEYKTRRGTAKGVDKVTIALEENRTLGLAGESGCGKSTLGRSIMRLVPYPGKITEGKIDLRLHEDIVLPKGSIEKGLVNIMDLDDDQMRALRGKEIAYIFQDPMTSLNPVLTVGFQITEALKLHLNMSDAEANERAAELLSMVGIPGAANRLDDYPHQFSGGMRQRAMIAMALSCTPSILIADEPTTALDVTIQAQIIDLVKQLQEQLGMAIIWITHDLGVTAGIAQRVNVMYAGRLIEAGVVKDIYSNPHHPYTVGLLGSLPKPDMPLGEKLFSIKGEPPDLVGKIVGCPFAPRCTYTVERCTQENPVLEPTEPGHLVACWEKDKVRKV